MRVVKLMMIVIFSATCGWAQSGAYATLRPNAVPMPAPVESAPVPNAPLPHRVVDKRFLFVMGALAASEATRITTTTLVLDNEAAEGAPWVSAPPAHGTLIAKNSLIFLSELLVAYEMKKPHSRLPGDRIVRKLWWVSPAVMSTIHFKAAAHNIALGGQQSSEDGCTSLASCESQ